MRRELLIGTAAVLAGLAYASAQGLPGGAAEKQPGAGSATQSQGGPGGAQAPQRSQKAEQGGQITGQGQREQGPQGKQQAQPQRDQNQNRGQTTGQGQREQGPQGKQQAQPQRDQNQGDQTTGQRQRDQGQREQGKQAQPQEGQARDQGRIELTAEQQTRINQTVLSRRDAPRVNEVNFSISVGTVVPSRVRAVAVPPAIIEIRPEFRGHLYFVVRDEIIIIDRSRRIVAVIPVRERVGARGGGGIHAVVELTPEEIRQVQLVLIERGFSVEADGILGPRTRQALIQFQQREGLQVTGQIDSRTVAALGVSVRSLGGQEGTIGQGGRGDRGDQSPGRGEQRGQGANPPPAAGQGGMQRGQDGTQKSPSGQAGSQPGGTTGQGGGRPNAAGSSSGEGGTGGQGSGAGGQGKNPPANQSSPKANPGAAGGGR